MFDYSLEPGRKRIERKFEPHFPVISIITPFYSGAAFIMQTAISVLNQTFPYFEWIIVDDGSKYKNKEKLLNKISEMDERIRVFHKENEGLAATRDYGAKKSSETCKYLLFLDDDDVIDPTFIEAAYYSLETNKEASWCFGDVVDFENIELQWRKHYDPNVMLTYNLITATALIRKKDFWSVNGYGLRERNVNEDWNFWIKLIALGKFPVHMSFNGFWYRIKSQGELVRANSNQERTLEIVNKSKKNIKILNQAIEYPRKFNKWESIEDNNVLIPKYKKGKRKNVLFIIPWMVMGGADKFNIDLLKLSDKEKYNFTVVTTQPTEYIWRQKFEEYADSVFELSSFIDSKYWPAFLEYLIESRNIDLIFVSNSLTGYEIIPLLKAKFPNIPIMDYIHMEEWYNRNGGYSRDSSAFCEVIDRTLLCNKKSENILIDYFKRDPKKLNTVYIGVDEEKFNSNKYNKKKLKEKYNLPLDKKIIGFIARIDYQKRPFLFLEIVKSFSRENKDVIFIVAGDGPLLDWVKAKAKELRILKYIKFLGRIDVPEEIYAISDITLNCSIKEGLALTSYESLSFGVPVISSDVGGQSELINDEVGMIVPCLQEEKDVIVLKYSKEEVKGYTNALKKILSNLKYYKLNCRKRIIDGFTINKMIENMEYEIDLVIANPNKESISRGQELSNNMSTIKEYINQYYIGESGEYEYLCNLYKEKVYGNIAINTANDDTKKIETIESTNEKTKKSIRSRIYHYIKDKSIKLHIYNEVFLIMNLGLNIYYPIKQLILGILKFIFGFIKLELKRFCNLYRRIIK